MHLKNLNQVQGEGGEGRRIGPWSVVDNGVLGSGEGSRGKIKFHRLIMLLKLLGG